MKKNGRLEKPALGEHLSHPSLRSAHSSASTERGEVRTRERVRGGKKAGGVRRGDAAAIYLMPYPDRGSGGGGGGAYKRALMCRCLHGGDVTAASSCLGRKNNANRLHLG